MRADRPAARPGADRLPGAWSRRRGVLAPALLLSGIGGLLVAACGVSPTSQSTMPAVPTFAAAPVTTTTRLIDQDPLVVTPTPQLPFHHTHASTAEAAAAIVADHGYSAVPGAAFSPTGLSAIAATRTGVSASSASAASSATSSTTASSASTASSTASGASSASPSDEQVFFFHDGTFLGPDAAQSSAAVSVSQLDPQTVTVRYGLFHPEDVPSAPTDGAATVRFHWSGDHLQPLDPIPTADPAADGSRR